VEKSSSDSEDLSLDIPNAENEAPKRENEFKEIELPSALASMIEHNDPALIAPSTDTEEPNLPKLLTDIKLPKDTKSCTAIEL
jgi:hypothetical protein